MAEITKKADLKTLNVLIPKSLKIALIRIKVEQDISSYEKAIRGLCLLYNDCFERGEDLTRYFKEE